MHFRCNNDLTGRVCCIKQTTNVHNHIFKKLYNYNAVIPRFTSLICSSKTALRWKLVKRKLISDYFPTRTTTGLWEEVAHISENWLANWKTGINLCISYKQKLMNRLLTYRGITVLSVFKKDWCCFNCADYIHSVYSTKGPWLYLRKVCRRSQHRIDRV
jgi:hypothetical protein